MDTALAGYRPSDLVSLFGGVQVALLIIKYSNNVIHYSKAFTLISI